MALFHKLYNPMSDNAEEIVNLTWISRLEEDEWGHSEERNLWNERKWLEVVSPATDEWLLCY